MIIANNSNVAGLLLAKLNGTQDTVDFAIDWIPDCLEGNDDD